MLVYYFHFMFKCYHVMKRFNYGVSCQYGIEKMFGMLHIKEAPILLIFFLKILFGYFHFLSFFSSK